MIKITIVFASILVLTACSSHAPSYSDNSVQDWRAHLIKHEFDDETFLFGFELTNVVYSPQSCIFGGNTLNNFKTTIVLNGSSFPASKKCFSYTDNENSHYYFYWPSTLKGKDYLSNIVSSNKPYVIVVEGFVFSFSK
ncbi:hypothetical protein XMG59_002334 [Marinobacterium sp. xm-g-59]|uniref:hypothetical protein n=1 Tax=Marinobacterium sp. xm-g-59 TaxID=2497748 RepID=UPI00156977D1|nr:hypothetical protein [Marinobacterium sp. xm-g-59]NRP96215.1 hypothetical protein [Marinobacterium sp. xm-g-59]